MNRSMRCLIMLVSGLVLASRAFATFSISACDSAGNCGVAIATNNLAVGATTIFAESGAGVVVTQFESNPFYGPRGLAALRRGRDAAHTLAELLAGDDNFEGQDVRSRQVAVIDAQGGAVAFTGALAAQAPWAGELKGRGYAIIGNGLAGPAVLRAMERAYLQGAGPLAQKLMAALQAGEEAGGQSTGRMSAALLVRTPAGGFADLDLRVDADPQPVRALSGLLALSRAHLAMLAAERAETQGRSGEVDANLAEALRLGARWDRIWRRAARLEMRRRQPARAVDALATFFALNPAWARIELEDRIYDDLRQLPEVQRMRAPE